MNLSLIARKDGLEFRLPYLAPLSWVAFGIETGALWFFGRSVFTLQFERSRCPPPSEEINFSILPLLPGGSLEWSNAALLSDLPKNRFPVRLVAPWSLPGNQAETLLNFEHLDITDKTLGFLAYGVADMVTDFFKRGAITVRTQYSLERAQLWANTGLTEPQARDLISLQTRDYNPEDYVGILPWPAPV